MESNHIFLVTFLIFTGAAVVSTLALYTRQSLLVAYMLLGIMLGPWGFRLVPDAELARQVGDIGIILLLFLLGLEMDPRDLWRMLRKISWIGLISSLIFFAIGAGVGFCFGFKFQECVVIGAAMMFSSTIIGLKLLPSADLRHKRIGEVMVSILLLQDLIAIVVMLFLHAMRTEHSFLQDVGVTLITLPSLLLIGFLGERFLIRVFLERFEQVQEYVFLVAIAWCLGLAKLALVFGLPPEIGAFIAGVAIAEGPIAHYIDRSLKPIRDFFLVMFFFTIGAQFNLQALPAVLLPSVILAILMLSIKPWVFKFLLKKSGESVIVAQEASVRLGQTSEFSLLVGGIALELMPGIISPNSNYLIQTTTILTFMISCYWVVLHYPTPMAFNKKLQRD